MLSKNDLKTGHFYLVQGKGNDIFKNKEKVLFYLQDHSSYIFKQGSVEIIINELGIDKFLNSMEFIQSD